MRSLGSTISDDEFRSGFRYLPKDFQILDSKGRFIKNVVGLRSLADGVRCSALSTHCRQRHPELALLVNRLHRLAVRNH